MILPKGFKIPHGMSMKEAQKAMAATAECVELVKALTAGDDALSASVRCYIFSHSGSFPVLAEGIGSEV